MGIGGPFDAGAGRNAIKHARGFDGIKTHVAFGQGDRGSRLLVRDHGPELPPGFDLAKSDGLGARQV